MNAINPTYLHGRIPVPKEFEEVFSHFYFAINETAQTITKTLLPSYQTMLIFNFGIHAFLHSDKSEQIEIDKCAVLGPVKKAFDYSLPPRSHILIANFKDDAFYRFFGAAAAASHVPIDPDGLLEENCFITLWKRLNECVTATDQVTYLLEFCKPYLKDRNSIAAQMHSSKRP